jgi:hypothetical protein
LRRRRHTSRPSRPGIIDVEDHRVGRATRRGESSASSPSAASGHLVVLEPQRALERPPHGRLVIDDQNARHDRRMMALR